MTKIQTEQTKIAIITTNEIKRKGFRISLKAFNSAVFSLSVILGVFYVLGANDLTIKGFELRDMKYRAMNAECENASLETRITALSSYSDIGKKVKNLGMVSVDKIGYLELMDSVVAKK